MSSLETVHKELKEELGVDIPEKVDGQPNSVFRFLFSFLNHYIINEGTYINNGM